MEEEKIQQQPQTNVGVETQVVEKVEQEKKLEDLPRVEDMRKSEKEIKTTTNVEQSAEIEKETLTQTQDRIFVKKADQKKALYKKRIKIVTGVYATVLTLVLAFVGVNIATLAILNKQVTTNTQTIQNQQQQIEVLEQSNPTAPSGEFQISLNEPRDYSEDKKELTWLDKVTILFRNLFS